MAPAIDHDSLSSTRRASESLSLLVLLLLIGILAASPASQQSDAIEKPLEATHGLVVSVSAPASEVGVDILKRGGNAVDAAVATALALAVTYPAAGNIGGGGFMVIFPGKDRQPTVVEYRESAPATATKTMFSKDDSWFGHKPVGVPGTVRGMALAHQKFGKLPWKEVVKPAIQLARQGFEIDGNLAASLNWIVGDSEEFPELRRVLGKNGTAEWQVGDRLVQADLANTLQLIADEGPDAFYQGTIAKMIVEEMRRGKGLISAEDLKAYRANVREPIHGTYHGYEVYAPPPPSSGGTCLVEMLNVLETFDLARLGRWSPETLHLMIETMRRAYCDRARYLGDPAFTQIPSFLTTKKYAKELAVQIDPHRASHSEDLARGIPIDREGDSTTHFSVIDKDGMAVANTFTLERSYGSRVVVRGAGFLLNDEMIDFNWRPGVTDRQGGIGTPANQIASGKRMLSSQTPTIVTHNGRVFLVTGSPGSRTIINTVLCMIINVLDFHMDIRAAVDAPRLHHQWFPDYASFEGTSKYPATVARLRKMGHTVKGIHQGDAHSILVDPTTGKYYGAADRRLSGSAVGY